MRCSLVEMVDELPPMVAPQKKYLNRLIAKESEKLLSADLG
jgi:hypothetical protein